MVTGAEQMDVENLLGIFVDKNGESGVQRSFAVMMPFDRAQETIRWIISSAIKTQDHAGRCIFGRLPVFAQLVEKKFFHPSIPSWTP